MKPSQARRSLLTVAVLSAALTSGCGFVSNLRAKNQLNEGARLYKSRQYAEAQQHFERAIELNPDQKIARFFRARAIHSQYKPGVEQEQNVAKAREAIRAYQEYLQIEPNSDEAYNAIVYLLRAIKDEQQEREWLVQRANLETIPAEKRSQAYTVLASKQWQCSYNITEREGNARTAVSRGQPAVERVRPKDQIDYDKARRCAERGMEFVEQAVGLDPDSEQAWSYNANLLLELVKLAETEGDSERAAAYSERAAEAQRRTQQLNEQSRKKRVAEEEKRAKESRSQTDPPK